MSDYKKNAIVAFRAIEDDGTLTERFGIISSIGKNVKVTHFDFLIGKAETITVPHSDFRVAKLHAPIPQLPIQISFKNVNRVGSVFESHVIYNKKVVGIYSSNGTSDQFVINPIEKLSDVLVNEITDFIADYTFPVDPTDPVTFYLDYALNYAWQCGVSWDNFVWYMSQAVSE